MDYFIPNIDDDKPIRQGDVFKIGSNCADFFMEEEMYAVVITADCDIAQNKMGDYYTLLPIITLDCFLVTRWLPKVLSSELTSLLKNHTEILNKSIAVDKYKELTIDSLKEWLDFESLDNIYIKITNKSNKKAQLDDEKIKLLRSEANTENFIKLRKEMQSKDDNKIINEINKSIGSGLSGDYYFLPEITSIGGMGSIIKLRDIRAMHKSKVYESTLSARLSQHSSDEGIIRIGQFSDYLKYSISQSFALLFSRIGMPEFYEKEVSDSLECFSKSLLELK
ncbi:hypothetical protein [Photobacterium leiognathi]|uniref:hypothetical protein n=1 Tax=Photobacterium leiognathi TaxID=553611 RepID=UPI002981EB8D|nr:hypothetical protein [Photobacterium leiognathi]